MSPLEWRNPAHCLPTPSDREWKVKMKDGVHFTPDEAKAGLHHIPIQYSFHCEVTSGTEAGNSGFTP